MSRTVEHNVRRALDYVRLLCDADRKRCDAQSAARRCRELAVAPRGASGVPVPTVERYYRHRFDGDAVEATCVDAHTVRVRSRNVEGLHSAVLAEVVPRDAGVERVGGEIVAP